MRYHAQPDIACQSVAEHSWGVAMLMMMFYPNATANMMKAAIAHDCGEAHVGDVPSPTKNARPEIREMFHALEAQKMLEMGFDYEVSLSPTELAALKLCDVLEGLWYTARQVRRTREGMECLINWWEYLHTLKPSARQLKFAADMLQYAGVTLKPVALSLVPKE